MKKIKYNTIHGMLLVLLALTSVMLTACEKDLNPAPVINDVRNYAAAPNDTLVKSVNPGQWIVLQGEDLNTVSKVTFCGVPATIKSALFSNGNLVVEIPEIAYDKVAKADLDVIEATNENGSAKYKIGIVGKPLITQVRNFSTSPNDTILKSILPGQKINIIGFNLKNATKISFQGVNADLSVIEYTDSSAVVQVPTNLSGGDASLINMISYTSSIGVGTYSIKIWGPPVVLSASYEIPLAGDLVYLYGSNLSNVSQLTFAGETISSFNESADGTTVSFTSPSLTKSGPIVITTPGGTFTTAYNVNDIVTGRISDFEWGDGFQWEWWGGATLASSDPNSSWPSYYSFPGSRGLFMVLEIPKQAADAGNSGNAAIRIPVKKVNNVEYPWMPLENLTDPAGSWALKFEMNVPKDWNGSSLCIVSENTNFMARIEPWQISATKTAAYKTNGWITVTIPLTSFKSKDATLGDGRGTPVTTLSGLLGADGKSVWQVYLHNYGSAETKTSFYGAFDNFRLVKR